jgi:hypothetical protein
VNVRRLLNLGVIPILLLAALGLGYTAYRRVTTPLLLLRGAVAVEGNVTEKLVQRQDDSLLPFDITTYVVRYAFPAPQGQMRTGEQIVTREFFERLGEQGAPVEVTLRAEDPAISAVDARLTFPASAGWRLGMAVTCLLAAYLVLLFGVFGKPRTKRPPPVEAGATH